MTSVGEILKKARLERGLLLKDIEKKIRVREKYLKAIEENNWSFFSSKIYIVGIINNYSRIFGLDNKKIIAFFRRDYEKHEEIKFKKKIASSYLTPESRKYLLITIFVSVSFVILYFGYQLSLYFSPPKVELISPVNTQYKVEDKIEIIGKAEKDSEVRISGNRIYLNQDGIFKFQLPLKEGNNLIKIEVIGANGKTTVIEKNFTKKSPK